MDSVSHVSNETNLVLASHGDMADARVLSTIGSSIKFCTFWITDDNVEGDFLGAGGWL